MLEVTLGRTQAERSAATRSALLDATIDCLVTEGFHGASSGEICRRAGVSRGAQLHHYPTKAELLVAALEHLCERRHAELRELVPEGADPSERLRVAFEGIWAICSGPTLAAWLELVVASRTDPVLSGHMEAVSRRLEEEAEQTLRRLFEIDEEMPVEAVVRMVLAFFDGLALRRVVQDEESVRRALTAFRFVIEPWLKR